jgi:hypothetical protein
VVTRLNRTTDIDESCHCPDICRAPNLTQKELLARLMVHTLDWGVLTTLTSRLSKEGDSVTTAMPFGNVYSFVAGPCKSNATTGTPYLYATYLDQSLQDMKRNPSASLTLSEASVASVCGAEALEARKLLSDNSGDPENPVCARLTLSGVLVEGDPAEFKEVQAAFFEGHTQMQVWPVHHNWVILKLVIQDIWLIDYFGGASILDVDDYHSAPLSGLAEKDEDRIKSQSESFVSIISKKETRIVRKATQFFNSSFGRIENVCNLESLSLSP